jgi:hypothetical protein
MRNASYGISSITDLVSLQRIAVMFLIIDRF